MSDFACPNCGRAYEQEFIICVNCGLDLRTGRRQKPQVLQVDQDAEDEFEEEEDQEPAPPSAMFKVVAWTAEYLPGLFRPLLLLSAILLTCFGIFVILMGCVLLLSFVLLGAMAMLAVGSLAYAQAVSFIVYGGFELLPEALADFDSTRWLLWFIGLLLPGVTFMALIYFGVITGQS